MFGAGYPSLPVYSVEEFFDQLVDKGCCMPGKGDNDCKYLLFFFLLNSTIILIIKCL